MEITLCILKEEICGSRGGKKYTLMYQAEFYFPFKFKRQNFLCIFPVYRNLDMWTNTGNSYPQYLKELKVKSLNV